MLHSGHMRRALLVLLTAAIVAGLWGCNDPKDGAGKPAPPPADTDS